MRLQLALDVTDLDRAVDFYTRLFDTPPAKRKPGYANFAIAEPPLKLVLFEGDTDGTINHLGVEMEHDEEVTAAADRLEQAGLDPTTVSETTCCHADKFETWVDGPDGTHWEIYRKVADADVPHAGRVERTDVATDGEVAAGECCPA